jgi:hypothetical protein
LEEKVTGGSLQRLITAAIWSERCAIVSIHQVILLLASISSESFKSLPASSYRRFIGLRSANCTLKAGSYTNPRKVKQLPGAEQIHRPQNSSVCRLEGTTPSLAMMSEKFKAWPHVTSWHWASCTPQGRRCRGESKDHATVRGIASIIKHPIQVRWWFPTRESVSKNCFL